VAALELAGHRSRSPQGLHVAKPEGLGRMPEVLGDPIGMLNLLMHICDCLRRAGMRTAVAFVTLRETGLRHMPNQDEKASG
jgi:hypothetical protein